MAYLTFSFSSKSRKKSSNVCKIMNSDGLDNRNWIFRVPEINQKWVYKTSWTSRFYFVIFAKFLMIFQSFAVLLVCSSLKMTKYPNNLAKWWKYSTFLKNQFLYGNSKFQKTEIQISDTQSSLIMTWMFMLLLLLLQLVLAINY